MVSLSAAAIAALSRFYGWAASPGVPLIGCFMATATIRFDVLFFSSCPVSDLDLSQSDTSEVLDLPAPNDGEEGNS